MLWTEKLLHKKNVFKYWRKCFYTILFLSQSRWLLQLNQFVDYSVSCDQQHPRLDKSQNFMTLINSALRGFFCQKFKKCNQISINFCYVVKGMLKLLCGWFMNWLHLLPYFLPHKLSVATKNIRRGKVLLVKQQVKGSYPHGIELLLILGTSLSIG